MDFFKTRTSWSNAEFVVLKLCLASAYLWVGMRFHEFFARYQPMLFAMFAVTVVWSMWLWLSKMKRESAGAPLS